MTRFWGYAWGLAALAVLAVVANLPERAALHVTDVLFWVALLAVAELLPVSLGFGAEVTMAFPIYFAVALLFDPRLAMLVAGAGAFDLREVKREIGLHRSLFNRAQTMLSTGAASFSFHALEMQMYGHNAVLASRLQDIIPLALAALVQVIVNLGLVGVAISIDTGAGLRAVLERMVPRPFGGFALSYALLSALGVVGAIAYERLPYGPLAVSAIFVPLLFARLSIVGARAQQELSEHLRKQQEALLQAAERVFQEREAERNRIAENIHDSSLQSLAAATYACSNVLDYLEAGQLDKARALAQTAKGALDSAIVELRASLVDLRRSAVTEGGLNESVRRYCEQASTLWGAVIDVRGEIHNEPPAPVTLAAFQIVQEALANALKHGNGGIVRVQLQDDDGGMVRIEIEDEGPGFDPGVPAGEEHHGMRLMHERAERVGGRIELDTEPGRGTRLTAVLPGGVPR